MGIAAYNRGSLAVSLQLRRDHGWDVPEDRPAPKPTPRPEGWGSKALTRATERARRIVASNARLNRVVALDDLIDILVDRERVGRETATAAARAVLEKKV